MILIVLVLVVMIIWLHHHPIRPVVLVVPASCTQLTKNCLSCGSFVGAPLVEVIKALALESQPMDKQLDHWGAVKNPKGEENDQHVWLHPETWQFYHWISLIAEVCAHYADHTWTRSYIFGCDTFAVKTEPTSCATLPREWKSQEAKLGSSSDKAGCEWTRFIFKSTSAVKSNQ